MAEFGHSGDAEALIPPITQEALADMIGTTKSKVGFFMNRFRKLGLIDYNGRIHVHRALLNVILLDKLPEENAKKPDLLLPGGAASRPSTAGKRRAPPLKRPA